MNLTDSVPEENLNPKKLSKKYYLVDYNKRKVQFYRRQKEIRVQKVNNTAWKDYSIMTMS